MKIQSTTVRPKKASLQIYNFFTSTVQPETAHIYSLQNMSPLSTKSVGIAYKYWLLLQEQSLLACVGEGVAVVVGAEGVVVVGVGVVGVDGVVGVVEVQARDSALS